MFADKLKVCTKHNHQILEKKLVARLKSISNTTDYTKFLSIFYSFFGGLEILIDKHIEVSHLPDYWQRRKTSSLVDDLSKLNAALPVKAGINFLPEITNHFHALGALYVIEGSTLGGNIISKMINKQLNLPDFLGLSYFNGYGIKTDDMWQVFKETINQPLTPWKEEMIIKSANDTFLQFSNWFDSYNY